MDALDPLDPLDPDASLEALTALPLEARPQVLLRLADDLGGRLDSAVTPPARPAFPTGPTVPEARDPANSLEHLPGRP